MYKNNGTEANFAVARLATVNVPIEPILFLVVKCLSIKKTPKDQNSQMTPTNIGSGLIDTQPMIELTLTKENCLGFC